MSQIAYVISRYPVLTETFILREILELERQGYPVDVYAIQRVHAPVRHPEGLALDRSVQALRPLSRSMIGANARFVAHDPRRYARLLATTVLGNRMSPEFLAKALVVFPWAIEIAEVMRARHVRHVHAHYGTHPALVAMLVSEVLGIGFSFTVHAHDLFVNTSMLGEKVRAARFVVSISDFNRECLQRLAGPDARPAIEVVRCGVDPGAYPFRARHARQDELAILAIGSLQPYKGHDRLIRACALLRDSQPELDVRCDIVGEGPLDSELEGLIDALGLQGRVRLLGGRDQHAVRALLDKADLLVLPSVVAPNGQMEGIPVVLMEAMACGVPVIASCLSGIPELVRHGDTGLLVPPNDPGAIRDAVLACWREPSAAAARARRGRRLVEQEYDLHTNVAHLHRLFADATRATAHQGTAALAGAKTGRLL